jgi:hypothetical protein
MRKPEHVKTVAITLPIAFLCSGCFTVLSLVSTGPEAGGGPRTPPIPPPPPVIIIENHFYPLPPAVDPPPPERERPFDRHEPGESKGEIDKPRTGKRTAHDSNNPSGGSETGGSGGRSPRR